MSEMICITCPLGCHLSIQRLSETEISVTGNRCSRGEAYAKEELLFPKRVVTSTCCAKRSRLKPETLDRVGMEAGGRQSSLADPSLTSALLYAPRRVPVRTRTAFPKERIFELLMLLSTLEVPIPVRRGDLIVPDALGTGIDVIATRTIE